MRAHGERKSRLMYGVSKVHAKRALIALNEHITEPIPVSAILSETVTRTWRVFACSTTTVSRLFWRMSKYRAGPCLVV